MKLVVKMMIDLGRNIFGYFNNIKNNNWDRNMFPSNQSLNGKTVGLVGGTTSDLGSAIIPMLLDNALLLQAGKPVKYVVNGQYLTV